MRLYNVRPTNMPKLPEILEKLQRPHRLWYVPIAFVVLLTHLMAAVLAFGVYYCRWFAVIPDGQPRLYFSLYCVGCLGAAMYAAAFLARDYNHTWYADEDFKAPTCLDWIGYLVCILGGGCMAIIVICAMRAGIWLGTGSSQAALRTEAAVFFSFAGGLSVYRLRSALSSMMGKIAKDDDDGVEPAQRRTKPKSKQPENGFARLTSGDEIAPPSKPAHERDKA